MGSPSTAQRASCPAAPHALSSPEPGLTPRAGLDASEAGRGQSIAEVPSDEESWGDLEEVATEEVFSDVLSENEGAEDRGGRSDRQPAAPNVWDAARDVGGAAGAGAGAGADVDGEGATGLGAGVEVGGAGVDAGIDAEPWAGARARPVGSSAGSGAAAERAAAAAAAWEGYGRPRREGAAAGAGGDSVELARELSPPDEVSPPRLPPRRAARRPRRPCRARACIAARAQRARGALMQGGMRLSLSAD